MRQYYCDRCGRPQKSTVFGYLQVDDRNIKYQMFDKKVTGEIQISLRISDRNSNTDVCNICLLEMLREFVVSPDFKPD